MARFSAHDRDPLVWCIAIAAAFLALAVWRLGIPTRLYFDEVHYVPAARKLLELKAANREHPLFAKELIAASIRLFGDTSWAWRLPSVVCGGVGLFAFSRLVWWSSRRRRATILAALLLATNFTWFIQSRIAMLDMVSAGLLMVGLWQFAAALAAPAAKARWRLLAAGVALGLSMGAKWSGVPAIVLPGLAFLALRVRSAGPVFIGRRGAGPISGVTMAEAVFFLGLLPLAVYWATYAPAFFYPVGWKLDPLNVIGQHEFMIRLQDSVRKPHPYRSFWYQWIVDWRAIWYLYEPVDGAQRGIVLIGNPFSMLAGLPALLWCLWQGLRRKRAYLLGFVVLYAACLGMWVVNGKPIQFYYHYLLPGAFLMACLAFALDDLWSRRDRWRWLAPLSLIATFAMFAYFFPIISAMQLADGKRAYAKWMWLDSWR
ncbi:glycosyl transferase [Novosphingobium sp. PC22D]|uniref:phospholipid carrier-dependent glycosyltransferase n=1 Tax=Novosphingobium sp. PC22D TaxID=1962403 RepID=UPI000BF1DCBC|nr:phospholipid carrier-dependent glycosyltransferase [Novosphingobium sp. PC22D]PEQ13728.1 glycosyl transferase [Novosphingobium sp. PC22D]